MNIEIIKNAHFKKAAASVRPDSRGRITLSKIKLPEDVSYNVYANDLGQIVLDPQVTIPASEAWLFVNDRAISAVRLGLHEAKQGKVTKVDMSDL